VRTHDNEIWLHFKHEESKDGLMSREFQRCYMLPEGRPRVWNLRYVEIAILWVSTLSITIPDVNMSSVRSHLRKDGMLVIDADKR